MSMKFKLSLLDLAQGKYHGVLNVDGDGEMTFEAEELITETVGAVSMSYPVSAVSNDALMTHLYGDADAPYQQVVGEVDADGQRHVGMATPVIDYQATIDMLHDQVATLQRHISEAESTILSQRDERALLEAQLKVRDSRIFDLDTRLTAAVVNCAKLTQDVKLRDERADKLATERDAAISELADERTKHTNTDVAGIVAERDRLKAERLKLNEQYHDNINDMTKQRDKLQAKLDSIDLMVKQIIK